MRRATLMLAASLAILVPVWLPGGPDLAHADGKAEASRHFKLGVALYAEEKFDEALYEFQRAYELSPHPSVLYNIAATHRELSHYGDAIQYYERFLSEGKGVARTDLLARARVELQELRGRIGSVVVDVTPAGVAVMLDGREVGTTPLDGPVIVGAGRHTFTLRAPSGQVETRTVTLTAGDTATVALTMTAPAGTDPGTGTTTGTTTDPGTGMTTGTGTGGTVITDSVDDGGGMPGMLGVSASVGANVLQLPDASAPMVGAHVRVGSRVLVGADAVFGAWAVVPSLRVHLGGDRTAVHAIAALPLDFYEGFFVAGAAGLGLRVWATDNLAVRLEALASYAGSRGFSLPVFMGVELWR